MNITLRNLPASLLAAGLGLALAANLSAQTTAFTYQGRLNEGATPANGIYDLRFTLHGDAVLPGFQVGLPQTNSAVAVTNGLFTSVVDFGGAWDNQPRWIEVAVRPAGSTNAFAPLAPRQWVTVAPKADYANRAATLSSALTEGLLPASTLRRYVNETVTGFYTFNPLPGNPPFAVSSSVVVPSLNVDLLDGLDSSAFWKLGGNAGTTPGTHFLGTTDNQALELKVNNARALRLEPNTTSPNVIGGYVGNLVGPGNYGSTIAGGGRSAFINSIYADYTTIGGGRWNTIQTNAQHATIGGGYANTIESSAQYATIDGGRYNTIQSSASDTTIGGGNENTIEPNASDATIGGGSANTIETNADFATIGGGTVNTIQPNAYAATIPGGYGNSATNYAFAAGRRAKANHTGAFVWADSQNADFTSTANNQFLVRADGGVGINKNNPATALDVNGTITAGSFISAGDLGLGTSNPESTLDVRGPATFQAGVLGNNDNLVIKKEGNLSSVSNVRFVFSHRSGGTELWLYSHDGTTYKNLQGWDHASNRVYFPANGNTLIIDQKGGRVGIGRHAWDNVFEVEGNASKTVAGSWLANSDARIKQDIATVTDALDTLDRVRLVSFRYTEDYQQQHPSVADQRYLNVVAQEFREVFPHAVKSSGEKLPDGSEILQVDTYPLTIYSAAAIQELNQKLKQKESKISELESRLEKLEQLLNDKLNGGAR